MDDTNNKGKKRIFAETAFVVWLKYDPFVALALKNDDLSRRDVMLNLLGKKAAEKYFGKYPAKKKSYGPIYPQTVREIVEKSLHDPSERSNLIKKLIFWATDPEINNRYIKSHETRKQIVNSILGTVFFHATTKQEGEILKGLKFMLVKKHTSIGLSGEQSFEVHELLLTRIIDLLIHNQKVIINKAVKEAEEKMRVHLLRQIQELRGEKFSTGVFDIKLKSKVKKIIHDKFPLEESSSKHLFDMLEFEKQSQWPEISLRADDAHKRIQEIRKPLTLTSEDLRG